MGKNVEVRRSSLYQLLGGHLKISSSTVAKSWREVGVAPWGELHWSAWPSREPSVSELGGEPS